jgi:hypothetical protein
MFLSRRRTVPNPDAVILTEDREADRPLKQRHWLGTLWSSLLDQQLKRLAKEDNHAIERQARGRP